MLHRASLLVFHLKSETSEARGSTTTSESEGIPSAGRTMHGNGKFG